MDEDRAQVRVAASRWYRPVVVGVTFVFLAFALLVAWVSWTGLAELGRVGADLSLYLDATRRWIDGGSFYLPHQLAGPFVVTDGDILYPPSTIPLFAAFLVLPTVMFWVVPLTVIIWVTIRYRPAIWTWPLMALCLAWIPTMVKIAYGNPFMWAGAAVALGTAYGWPALFVIVKPSVAPFALVGVGHRSWWVGLVVIIVAGAVSALLFTSMWRDYLTVLTNSQNGAGLLYNMTDAPFLLIPVIAYVGRTRNWSGSGPGSVPAE